MDVNRSSQVSHLDVLGVGFIGERNDLSLLNRQVDQKRHQLRLFTVGNELVDGLVEHHSGDLTSSEAIARVGSISRQLDGHGAHAKCSCEVLTQRHCNGVCRLKVIELDGLSCHVLADIGVTSVVAHDGVGERSLKNVAETQGDVSFHLVGCNLTQDRIEFVLEDVVCILKSSIR